MRRVYLITYDLRSPGRNYDDLHRRIHNYGYWAMLGGSSYVIVTNSSAVEIRNNLMGAMDRNDKIFVGQVAAHAAWGGMPEEVSNWLRNHLNN